MCKKPSPEEIFGPKLTEEEVMRMIQKTPGLYSKYLELSETLKSEFLEFCMGERGLNLTYDPMFKAVFNPQQYAYRLEEFLSLCLGEEVKILHALPTESSRLTDEGSLLVMDLLVQLESGALADVEIQKVGYLFPGQRCACYSSDLVMRQYSLVRAKCREKNQPFSYQQIKKVYTIVLFQKSPKEFHKFPGKYLHHARQRFDTGLELDLLQEYLMIPLDIFLKSQQNIDKKIEAWLTLIAADDMERIRKVLEAYPEFGEIYCQVFQFRRKVEELMGMYSDALRILDANTVKYMIEQQREEIEQQNERIEQQNETIEQQNEAIQQQKKEIDSVKQELSQKEAEYHTALSEKELALSEKDRRIKQLEEMIARAHIEG